MIKLRFVRNKSSQRKGKPKRRSVGVSEGGEEVKRWGGVWARVQTAPEVEERAGLVPEESLWCQTPRRWQRGVSSRVQQTNGAMCLLTVSSASWRQNPAANAQRQVGTGFISPKFNDLEIARCEEALCCLFLPSHCRGSRHVQPHLYASVLDKPLGSVHWIETRLLNQVSPRNKISSLRSWQ